LQAERQNQKGELLGSLVVMILNHVQFQFFLRIEDHSAEFAFEFPISFGSGASHDNTPNRYRFGLSNPN
jgi:hypothetical protein